MTERCEAYACSEWGVARVTLSHEVNPLGRDVYYCEEHLKGLLEFGESPQYVLYLEKERVDEGVRSKEE